MNPLGLRVLAVPLLVVAVLAVFLGFFVARSVAGGPKQRTAEVSVVSIPSTPGPLPSETAATASPTSGGTSRGRSSRSGPSCPSGCECQFPPGGTVVMCHGGSVKIP